MTMRVGVMSIFLLFFTHQAVSGAVGLHGAGGYPVSGGRGNGLDLNSSLSIRMPAPHPWWSAQIVEVVGVVQTDAFSRAVAGPGSLFE